MFFSAHTLKESKDQCGVFDMKPVLRGLEHDCYSSGCFIHKELSSVLKAGLSEAFLS